MPEWFKWEGTPIGNGDVVGVLKAATLVKSRVDKVKADPAAKRASSDDVTDEAVASLVADEIETLQKEWEYWPKISGAVTAALDWPPSRMKRWMMDTVKEGKNLPAGHGRRVEFVKRHGTDGNVVKLHKTPEIDDSTSSDTSFMD